MLTFLHLQTAQYPPHLRQEEVQSDLHLHQDSSANKPTGCSSRQNLRDTWGWRERSGEREEGETEGGGRDGGRRGTERERGMEKSREHEKAVGRGS